MVLSTFNLDGKGLETIYVYDTFVSFKIVNGRASFVYSVNGEKPRYVNRPDEGKLRIHVEKIFDNWYYACMQ